MLRGWVSKRKTSYLRTRSFASRGLLNSRTATVEHEEKKSHARLRGQGELMLAIGLQGASMSTSGVASLPCLTALPRGAHCSLAEPCCLWSSGRLKIAPSALCVRACMTGVGGGELAPTLAPINPSCNSMLSHRDTNFSSPFHISQKNLNKAQGARLTRRRNG